MNRSGQDPERGPEAAQLSADQRKQLEQALDQRERELLETVSRLRDRLATPPGATGPEVRDAGDEGQIQMASSQDLMELDRCEREIGGISAARLRMRQGTYGLCEVCEENIPFGRLRALPTASLCLRHEEERERAIRS